MITNSAVRTPWSGSSVLTPAGTGLPPARPYTVNRMFSPRNWWAMPSVRASSDSGPCRP